MQELLIQDYVANNPFLKCAPDIRVDFDLFKTPNRMDESPNLIVNSVKKDTVSLGKSKSLHSNHLFASSSIGFSEK